MNKTQIENTIRALKRLLNKETQTYLEMGRLLFGLIEGWPGNYNGYLNVYEFIEIELGIALRKAQHLVHISNTASAYGLTWEDFEGVGWSKVVAVLPKVKSKQDAKKLLGRARYQTLDAIKGRNRTLARHKLFDLDDLGPRQKLLVQRVFETLREEKGKTQTEVLYLLCKRYEKGN